MKTSKHLKLANGQPAISCFTLEWAELKRRNDLAHERAAAKSEERASDMPDLEAIEHYKAIARRTMWHTDFLTGLKLLVCDTQLFELAACLPMDLKDANAGEPLDFWDFAYLADMLRELLTQGHCIGKGDRLCLKRALAWVEGHGSGLWDHSQE
ncbi:MAG: hypothetical protein ACRYG7_13155 [Janthinobacterium lividum]